MTDAAREASSSQRIAGRVPALLRGARGIAAWVRTLGGRVNELSAVKVPNSEPTIFTNSANSKLVIITMEPHNLGSCGASVTKLGRSEVTGAIPSYFVRVDRLLPTGAGLGSSSSDSSLLIAFFCLGVPRFFGLVSSASESLSFFGATRLRFEFAGVPLVASSSISLATAPVFFWTAGTTALVRPPTVRKVILSPFGRTDGWFFLPFPHRCLKSQCSGNFSESASTPIDVEQT